MATIVNMRGEVNEIKNTDKIILSYMSEEHDPIRFTMIHGYDNGKQLQKGLCH